MLAESGMRKSPILQTAFTPIKRADGRRWRDYRMAMTQYEAPPDWKPEATPASATERAVVDDITPEKLAELLGGNHGAP